MGRRITAPPSANQPLTLSPSTRRPLAAKLTAAATAPPATMSPMPVAAGLADAPPLSCAASCARSALPTRRISAAATPSGYGRSLCTTIT